VNDFDLEAALSSSAATPKLPPRSHPNQWAAGIEIGEHGGTITTAPTEDGVVDWVTIFAHWNLDPDQWEVIDETIKANAWDAQTSEGDTITLRQYKADVRPKRAATLDVADLISEVKKWKPKQTTKTGEPGTLLVCVADTQIGKGLESGGSDAIVSRWMGAVNETLGIIADLTKLGTRPDRCVVAFMGDLVESCDGHYDMQTHTTDLTRREQETVVRRLATKTIRTFADIFPHVDVVAVPGNHGENRRGGKAFTRFSDNADVALIEQSMEILAENPGYGHVYWYQPPGEDLTVTLDLSGVRVGFIHGHQATRGATPTVKMLNWWQRMAFDEAPIGDAQLLCTAHYHHAVSVQQGRKALRQMPSLDNGSQWWANTGGGTSPPGMWLGIISDRTRRHVDQEWIVGQP